MLSKIINTIYPISIESIRSIEILASVKDYKKKDVIVNKGEYNSKEYFVLDGIVRSYILNPEGEEITISFFCSNSIVTPHVARTIAGKSQLTIQALTDTKLAIVDAGKFEHLRSENKEARSFAATVLQNELLMKVSKEIGLVSLTAKERLKKFRTDFYNLENLIPHPYIASYLGITNISLSRLRSEVKE